MRLKLPKDNPIHQLHIIGRQVLGVQKRLSNIGVLLEVGNLP